jgi:dipeptidyl aminopeptidase/acylaminoacyl peptidase
VPDIAAFLRIRSAHSPLWLDGGERLAFLSDITGIPQLWAMPATGGWPDQLTFAAERVSGAVAGAGGSLLAFGRDVGGNERDRLWLAEPERPLAEADAIHALGAFSPDGALLAFTHTERNGTDFDLAVLEVATGHRRELELEGWNVVCDFTAHGILVARAHSNVAHDLYLVDPADGEPRPLTAHAEAAQYLPARLCDDGTVLCASDRGNEHQRLARLREDGSLEFLTADDADVEAIEVHGDRVAYVRNVEGSSRLVLDGEVVDGLPDGVFGGLAFSPDGRRLALHIAPADGATDVYVVGDGVARVTRSSLGGVPRDVFRTPELHELTASDGVRVPYFLFGPRDAPTLCHVHGGPESQARPALNAVIQYLAARGISVAVPNVRGSTGYGKTFTALDDVEKRPDAVRDLAELAIDLGARRGVPVGVMGGSYGGYMTLAAISEYPDLWRAAVCIVGIANFVTFLERTGSYRRKLREAEYGSLEHDRDLLERLSPIHHVDRITAPLMVIHGANDPRVPVHEAEQIVAALQERGREVVYLRYDDEGHGLVRLANRIDAYPQVAAFLERTLLG